MDRLKYLKEELAAKEDELRGINDKLDQEKRKRTEEEKTQMAELRNEIKELREEIEEKEAFETEVRKGKEVEKEAQKRAAAAAGNFGADKPDTPEERDILKVAAKYDLAKAVRNFMGEPMSGVEKELHEEAIRERNEGGGSYGYNGVGIPGSVLGAELKRQLRAKEYRTDIDQATSAISPTVVGQYVEAIRQNSVALTVIPSGNVLTGLTADFKIPAVGSQTTAWAAGENGAAGDGGANFTTDTMTPKRITNYADISDKVILQNGSAAMNIVMTDFGRSAATTLDNALFATTSTTNAPSAIAATSGVGTFNEAATYAAPSSTVNGTVYDDVLAALQVLANANTAKGALAFVGHTKLMSDLIKSPQVLSVSPAVSMWTPGAPIRVTVNGIPFYLTTSNTSNGTTSADFIAGDFNFQYLGFFGGLDISIDPYSVKLNAQKRIVLHRWVDASTIRGAAFVKSTTLLS